MYRLYILPLLCFLFLLTGCSASEENPQPLESPKTHTSTTAYKAMIDTSKKIELTRDRQKEMHTIRKGDYMMTKNNPKEALSFYLPTLEKLPQDTVLEGKIANAYYALKDFGNAYTHFIQVPLSDLSPEDHFAMMASLFSQENDAERAQELQKLPLNDVERAYFLTLNACYAGVKECTNTFLSYSGSDKRIIDLREVLKNAHTISPQEVYKDFLLATKLYEQKMYRLSAMIASEVLAINPGYKEVKKLRGFSLYELGKYTTARDILLEYLETAPKDLEVIVRLGEIFSLLGNYRVANLYFNNAIFAQYTPKTPIERHLAYNYSRLGDKEGMKKVLGYLLQEPDVTEDDFAVAISLALSNGENVRAYAWSYDGIQKFPYSKILPPLYIQSLRLSGKGQDAQRYIKSLPKTDQTFPLIELEKAILFFDANDRNQAKKIFQALVDLDADADFGQEAATYLSQIEIQEQQEKERAESGTFIPPPSHDTMPSFWDF